MSEKLLKQFSEAVVEHVGAGAIYIPELGINIPDEKIEVISTGCKAIDDITGIGGLPRGRFVEIFGSEASGKTTLALSTIAQGQKMGLRAGYIDTEQALERNRATELGVDFDKLAISQPDNAEEALELLEMMVVSKAFQVVVVDSVASLVPKAELEGEMQDATIGVTARLMGKILRKIGPPVNKNKVLVIFINQVRQQIGGFMPFPLETTPGGKALKFAASMRIDMRKVSVSKAKDPVSEHKVTIKKNKLGIPAQSIKVHLGRRGFVE